MKVLWGLCDILLTVSLASLEANCSEEICHLKAVGERFVGSTQSELCGKPAVEPGTCGMSVGVVDQQLSEVTLIDEDTSKEEHVAVMAHFLEVGLEAISIPLMRWNGIGGVVIEEGVAGQCE